MKIRFLTLLTIILGVSLLRLLPHPPNFTPVMAMALFAGAHFAERRLAFIAPIVAMLIADMFLGFHASMPFVYAGVAICVLIGAGLRGNHKALRILSATLAGSLLFFILTNFGAWLFLPDMYPRNVAGLLAAYIAAIPFYYNSLLGDAFYTTILFGGFVLAQRTWPLLREPQPA